MRIASLVPSATEALFALGLGDHVVAVTHECDFPEAVRSLPKLTASVIEAGLEPGEIDARVREVTGRGESLYWLDIETLDRLAPDLIVTQALCAVCAVSYEEVCDVAGRLASRPGVISQDPTTIEDVLADMRELATAAGVAEQGDHVLTRLRARLGAVSAAVEGAARPRVAALEWFDPVYAGGHWVPEMIALAGGSDVLGTTGEKSRVVGWDEVRAARPEVVVAMPCGLYCDEAAAQAGAYRERLASVGAARVFAVDAASSFSRPGPRLVDGVELLAHLLHPELAPHPPGIDSQPVFAAAPQAN